MSSPGDTTAIYHRYYHIITPLKIMLSVYIDKYLMLKEKTWILLHKMKTLAKDTNLPDLWWLQCTAVPPAAESEIKVRKSVTILYFISYDLLPI